MGNMDMNKLVVKGGQAVCYILGSALLTYNLTAFKLTKKVGALYYLDANQTWMAIGAALIALGLSIKNWNRM